MAIHASSIPATIVQPPLRAGGPCRVLTDADVVALTAETVLTLNVLTAVTLDMLDAIEPETVLHFGAPLPSLQMEFSRRRQILGAFHG